MSLNLSKVTSAWAYSLAELQPVPQGELTELLQVCTSDLAAGNDAGGILQKIMPLTVFLEKAHDKNVQQVVPAVVQLLQQLPSAWRTPQTGPQQVQADFTQVMVDLRRAVRNPAVPAPAKKQLSGAVLALMQQLFKAVAQQSSCQDPGWQKCGCYLLLRVLTRTPEFLQDPGLPMMPQDAARMLDWLKHNTLQIQAAGRGAKAAASSSNGTAAVQGGALPAQDDKPLLLLTKLVLATTAAPAAVAAAAAESDGAGYYSAITTRGHAVRANGASSLGDAAYAAADAGAGFANGIECSVASAAAGACVLDPVLLCQLLEWSSTRVTLALQWLLDRQTSNTADAPSREATTAAAALAATCIYILQSGGRLAPDLEQQLSQQVSSLLEVALTVGEAAVASASEHSDLHKGSEADMVMALGARILASMSPFMAAAAQRVSSDDLFVLTSRLQQIMLSAAGLAARQRGHVATAAGDAVLDMSKSMSFHDNEALAGGVSSQLPQHLQRESAGSAEAPGPLSARLRRLALRKEAAQQRKLQKQLRQQAKRQRRGLREGSAGRKGLRRAADAGTQAGLSWDGDAVQDAIGAGQQLGSRGPQLRPLENTPYPRLTVEDKAHPWSWDVTQSLTIISGGTKLADLPLSTGVGGFLLARAACEMLCEAMAAGWPAGHCAPVRKLMLLPAGGNAARMVTALAMGRLYAKLDADQALGQLLLPLLADLLSSSNTADARLPSDRGSTAGQAEVGGAVLCALEGMASVCVQHGRDQWLYEQALQLLLSLYMRPTALSLQLLAGPKAPASTAGLLADTLHLLAAGLEDAPQRTRKELSLKLLLLFSNAAAGISSGTGVVRADLGRLLVAVAVAAEGLDRGMRLLRDNASSSNSISRMSAHDIQSAQREGASTTRLFRSLWLYTAIHQLVQPSAGTRPPRDSRHHDSMHWDWQVAAGRLAAVTPMLVVGTTSYFEADLVEKLKIELGEQLSQAGSLGSASSLSSILLKLLGGKPSLNGQALPQPHEAVLLGFVVAVAASELSRAALAPLPDVDDEPVVACPIAISLAYLKGVLPDGAAAAWVAAIVRRAAELYIERLLALAAKQEREEEDEDADVTSSTAPALAYAEQLACVLIANLGDGGLKNSAEGSLIPTVAALTDSLLRLLLTAFPALYHSHACYAALLAQLQEEEGDTTMGQVQAAQAGVGWVRTRAWVSSAATRAPMTTEAFLHSFITSSDSLPGATAPAWLRDDASAGPRLGAVQDNRKAQKAAYRRAADLLRACVEARMQQGGAAAAADSAYEGALGLTRKLHYTGYVQALVLLPEVQGVINGRNSGTSVLQEQLQRQEQQQERERRQQPPAQLLLQQQAEQEAQQLAPPASRTTVPIADGTDDDASSSSSLTGNTEALLQNLRDVDASAAQLQNGTATLARAGAAATATAAATAAAGATPLATSALDGCSGDSTLGSLDVSSPPALAAVVEEIAGQLDQALLQPGLHDAKLAQAQLCAAALLAVQADAFTYSSSGLHILCALAHAPLRRLTPETMRLSQFCWCWVNVESPEILVPLLSAITNAWIRTIDRRLGLFSGTTPAAAATASAAAPAAGGGHADGRGDIVNMLAEDHGADNGTSHDDALLQAMWAHFLWLSFLQEQWAVISKLRDGRTAAARVMYGRLLAASLQDPAVLSHHPAALGAYFRLLTLALQYGRSCLPGDGTTAGADVLLLFDKILQTALLWFRSPPRYFARCTRRAAAEQVAALEAFKQEVQTTLAGRARARAAAGIHLPDANWPTYVATAATTGAGDDMPAAARTQPHPVWGRGSHSVGNYTRLLLYLCDEELMRLRVWTDPLKYADASRATPLVRWRETVPVAWQVDPALALSLLDHFPAIAEVKSALEHLVVEHAASAEVQMLPKAAMLLANAPDSEKHGRMMRYLPIWAPGTAAEGLELLSGPTGGQAAVRSYAIKCLFNAHPEKLVFFLPQLVQLLRGDADGAITNFFLTAAAGSDLFGHQLIWALNSEARPPEEAFNPEVKRSGWQPPKDTGLWDYSTRVGTAIQEQMTSVQQEYWQGENGYFSQVTALSGYLYKFSKDERRVKLHEALAQFKPPRSDLYLPTNPEARVRNHIPSSGACMQSAAKVPILVAFDVEVPAVANSAPSEGSAEYAVAAATAPAKMACIFKVGDDIRQDVLAIQVIKLLHDAFSAAGLNLYLRPYGCLPTGYECGIIEVVPNTKSRAALGEVSDRGLHDIFCSEFGPVGSPEMERARENFIVSEAAYAVASYLLQAKDRHNGNIMLDDQGHIVHIDFGFILEISPGGNLGFESAAFKLSHEMTQLLDPGGRRTSPQFKLFTELVIRAYLAARTVAEPIIATVSLMAESGLPCFSRGAPVANLRNRFHLEMNDAQAAAFMRSQIDDAYDKWTTGFYDYIQSLQNKIPY